MARARALGCPNCRRYLALAVGVVLAMAVVDRASAMGEITLAASSASSEHLFGGRALSVSITLEGPQEARADLRARLVLLTSGLAVPVGAFRDIASDVDFGRGLRRQLTFDLEVPAVERESRFEAAIFARAHPAGDWRRLGSASFRVYPNDLLKALKRWTEDRPIRVHDPSAKLERFLTAQGISFLDRNARTLQESGDPLTTLVVGGGDALALAKRWAERGDAVVLFTERVSAFPRIERAWGPRGALTVVELALLDRLPTDPRAQKLLLELITSTRPRETNEQEED